MVLCIPYGTTRGEDWEVPWMTFYGPTAPQVKDIERRLIYSRKTAVLNNGGINVTDHFTPSSPARFFPVKRS